MRAHAGGATGERDTPIRKSSVADTGAPPRRQELAAASPPHTSQRPLVTPGCHLRPRLWTAYQPRMQAQTVGVTLRTSQLSRTADFGEQPGRLCDGGRGHREPEAHTMWGSQSSRSPTSTPQLHVEATDRCHQSDQGDAPHPLRPPHAAPAQTVLCFPSHCGLTRGSCVPPVL